MHALHDRYLLLQLARVRNARQKARRAETRLGLSSEARLLTAEDVDEGAEHVTRHTSIEMQPMLKEA